MSTFPIQLFVESTGRLRTSLTGSVYYNTTNRIQIKRGDTVSFEVKFLQRGTSTPFFLAPGATLNVAMKALESYSSSVPYCCFATTTGIPGGTPSDSAYTLELTASGATLNALFTSSSQAFVDVMFELSWTEDGTNWNSTSEPVQVRIYNEVVTPAVLIPPSVSSLSLAKTYTQSFRIQKNTGQEVHIDTQPIFGLKLGDIAQFKITMSMTPRKVGVAANYNAQAAIYQEVFACVDLSDVGNYDELPVMQLLGSKSFLGTNSESCGLFNLEFAGGALPTPNAVYGQSTGLDLWYESVDSDPTRTIDLYDVVCFLQIELIGLHNNWID